MSTVDELLVKWEKVKEKELEQARKKELQTVERNARVVENFVKRADKATSQSRE